MKTLTAISVGAFKAPGLIGFSTREVAFQNQAHQFAAGLYIITGHAATGKSTVARGIASSAIHAGWEDVAVLPVFEPNSPAIGDIFLDDSKFINDNNLSPVGPDNAFVGDLGKFLHEWQATRFGRNQQQAMLVVDSLARPMRTYLHEARKSMAAMSGGFYLADLAFAQRMNDICVRLNLTVLGVVSDELVPFARILNGVCQGMITCQNFATFTITDRPSERRDIKYRLTEESVTDAFDALGYSVDTVPAAYASLPDSIAQEQVAGSSFLNLDQTSSPIIQTA